MIGSDPADPVSGQPTADQGMSPSAATQAVSLPGHWAAGSGDASGAGTAEHLLRQLFSNHPLPMLIYDVNTLEILDANDALARMYGYEREMFLSMRAIDLLPQEDRPRVMQIIEAARRPGHSPYRPGRLLRHVRKDGAVRDVEIAAHDFEVDGRAAVLVAVTDVTDRLRAERERDALLARLHQEATDRAAILEQMADAVLVADAGGNVVFSNKAAHTMFAVTTPFWPSMLDRQLPWTILHADGTPTPLEDRPFIRALRGETVNDEFQVILGDGRELWTSASAGPLRDERGQIQGLVWVARETTEERRRRDREAQHEKLRALGEMAGGVAHDLNQYLGLVAGYGDLTMRALGDKIPDLEAARDALDVVVRAAMDGSGTVKRLLSFARPTQEGPSEAVDMEPLLREVAALTAPRWRDAAQERGTPISLLVEAEGETVVVGWPALLREALTNLIFNAVDALSEGGTITLRARRSADRVIVEVADSGIGIPADAMGRIFEPFFTTKGDRGTGLGLPIVFRIVERHRGAVTVSSPASGGTVVTMDLPAADEGPARMPMRPAPPVTSGLRILVVDDEPAIARMVAMMLTPHGHMVTTATSGEEALAGLLAADPPYDVVLSDLGLGAGINGWDLLERVRERVPNTRFILSTGWGAQIGLEEVRARGAESLLSKPYRLADLLEAVAGQPAV